MCNEFTPLWLGGMIGASFLFRRLTGHPYQQGAFHAALLAATLAGFAIVLLAPGNIIRMAEYPAGGKFVESFGMGLHYAGLEWRWLMTEPGTWGWLAFVAVFSAFVAPAGLKSARHVPALLAGLVVLVLGITFVGCFVGNFATGEDLATRGRNEMIVVMLTGLTCFVALGTRAVRLDTRGTWGAVVAVIACGLLCLPILYGRSTVLLNAERTQFDRFWLESMSRNATLKMAPDAAMVVPDRTVNPTVLMSADLTENPKRLPNDCIAIFYGKTSVIMHPGS
jgi:hypothetical protein